jgi:integrase
LAPLTVRGVQKAVLDAAERAGNHKRVHPHLFRHSYATWAINRGMNPIVLAYVPGHSSLTMTHSVYSHESPSDMYEAMAKLLVGD